MHHQVRSTEIVDDTLKLLPFNAERVILLKSNAIINANPLPVKVFLMIN